jgi:quinoprotein glucose dehydrogenase
MIAAPIWGAAGGTDDGAREWRHYGGDAGAMRYSPLDQINGSNVGSLKVAWVHHTEDKLDRPLTTIECTPVVADGVMYLTTARLQIRALSAATGKALWNFNPFAAAGSGSPRGVNRGVAYFRDGKDKRVFVVIRGRLLCLDAGTGEPVKSFGENGALDLKQHLDRDMTRLGFGFTSPPVIYEDLVIVGGGGGEGPAPAAPGHIRAYDVYTGKRRWIFHTIPFPGEFGHDTWPPDAWKTAGGANNWGGMSLDAKRGLMFVPTGSPTFDFYGGDRHGQNLFGNCVLALKAATGERVWHFQIVHHDLWDYDLPCQAALVTVRREGRAVEAVCQVTKTGMVFLFDRQTGKPIFGVEERPVPESDVPGEKAWPTQPFPLKPPPFAPQRFEPTDISPEARAYVSKLVADLRSGALYTPPSRQGTIVTPGTLGGGLWGGCCFEPRSGRLFVSSQNLPSIMKIVNARENAPYPYTHEGYTKLRDADGYPGVKPPWGQLTAIDLNEGTIVWQVLLGEHPELTARGIPKTGTLNMGGSIVTAGGLVFIGATMDERFRAFDAKTGKTLWETQLEAGGYATPCTYDANGKQYVVIAAGGGGRCGTKAGDAFVAFALS